MDDLRRARAIAQERAHRSPPAGAEARVFAALEARLGGPSGGGGSEGGGGDIGTGSSGSVGAVGEIVHVIKIVPATAALTVGGLGTLRVGALAVDAVRPGAPVNEQTSEVDDPPRAAKPVVEAPEPEPREPQSMASTPVSAATPPAPKPAAVSAPSVGDERRRTRGQDPASTPPAGIGAELALIERARKAGSPAKTIALLGEHARTFPSGSLVDERDALWSLASCEADQMADARARATKLAERHPRSPLLDRIAGGCPSLAPDIDAAARK